MSKGKDEPIILEMKESLSVSAKGSRTSLQSSCSETDLPILKNASVRIVSCPPLIGYTESDAGCHRNTAPSALYEHYNKQISCQPTCDGGDKNDEVDSVPQEQIEAEKKTVFVTDPEQNAQDQQPQIKKRNWPPRYYKHDMVFSILAVFVYVFDIVTDVILIIQYYLRNQRTEMWLSIGFVVAPSIVSGIVSLTWAYFDHKADSHLQNSSKNHNDTECDAGLMRLRPGEDMVDQSGLMRNSNDKTQHKIGRTIATFFQCGRIFRYLSICNKKNCLSLNKLI